MYRLIRQVCQVKQLEQQQSNKTFINVYANSGKKPGLSQMACVHIGADAITEATTFFCYLRKVDISGKSYLQNTFFTR